MSARYQAMPPHDFTSALEEAGLSVAEFAAILGEHPERISRMMFGLERVSYIASLVVTMLTVSDARELALLHAEIEPEGAYVEPRWSTFARPQDEDHFVEMETVVLDPPLRIGPPKT